MEIYINGIAGFIGSNIAKALIEDGYVVYGIPSADRTGSWKNLDGLDFRLPPNNMKLDCVIHLGMPSSSPMYKKDPFATTEAVDSTMKHIEMARKHKAMFIYASTSSIYNGNPTPWKEDMPIHVKDYYSETRYWLERMASYYTKTYGLKTVGLRLFSVYGPNDMRKREYANVVTQFALNVMDNKRPIIYGDGSQRRDFVHVYDVVRAFKKAIQYCIDTPVVEQIFNVGTGESYSFNDVIEIINKTLNTRITPKYTDRMIHNYVFDTLADTYKAESELEFKAKFKFEEEYPNYVREIRKIKDAEEFLEQ